jgi:hypothetical protein
MMFRIYFRLLLVVTTLRVVAALRAVVVRTRTGAGVVSLGAAVVGLGAAVVGLGAGAAVVATTVGTGSRNAAIAPALRLSVCALSA